MKIFVSSLIRGMEEFREAAVRAIESLGHEAITAENFPADPASPRIACLAGIREASLVILILGERYGEPLSPSDLSATHQEYREARGEKPVLAFVQGGGACEARQADFIREVEDWEKGHFRTEFMTVDQLGRAVTRAIHEHELSTAAAPVDSASLLEAACSLLRDRNEDWYASPSPQLRLAFCGGPVRSILRPVEIEDARLTEWLLQIALFGETKFFDPGLGNEIANSGDQIRIAQKSGTLLTLNELGNVSLGIPLRNDIEGIPVIIEEVVTSAIRNGLQLASLILDRIDSSQRISRVAIAAIVQGGEYMAWRKRAEHAASPNSVTHGGGFSNREPGPVYLSPADVPRAALMFKRQAIAEDLATLLRRRLDA